MPLLSSGLIGYFSLEWLTEHELTLGFVFGLYAVVTVLMSLGMLPTTFVAILTGFVGSGWKLLPFMIVAYGIASFFGYTVGQKTNREYWLGLIKRFKKGEDLIHNVEDKSNLFVFSCRLSPLLPFGISNVALSVLGVPLKRFLTWGTLGMLPRTILSVWLGVQAEDFASAFSSGKELPVFQLVTVVLILLSTGLIIRVFFKRNHN